MKKDSFVSKIKFNKSNAKSVTDNVSKKFKEKSKKIFSVVKILVVVIIALSLVFICAKKFANVTMSNVTDKVRGIFMNMGGEGYPYEIDGGSVLQSDNIGSYIALVEEDSLVYLNSNAKEVLRTEHNFTSPALTVNNGRGLFYNTGSKQFIVTGSSEILYTQNDTKNLLKGSIVTAAIGKKGNLAFATSTDEGTTQLSVFDNSLKEIYYFIFSSGRVADITLSDNGKFVSAIVLEFENASVYTRVMTFDVEKADPVLDIRVDEVGADIEYLSDHEVSVLTLTSLFTVNTSTGKKHDNLLAFEKGSISGYSFSESANECSASIIEHGGKTSSLTCISSSGDAKRSTEVSGVEKISKSKKYTSVLTKDKIYTYSDSGKLKGEIDLKVHADNILLHGNKLYVFSGNKIYYMIANRRTDFTAEY